MGVKKDVTSSSLFFSQGTLACAVAHNLNDLQAVFDPAVLQEASKTGVVLAVMLLGGQKILPQSQSQPPS